jgi:hypothetical protein
MESHRSNDGGVTPRSLHHPINDERTNVANSTI